MLFLYIIFSLIGKIGWTCQQLKWNRESYKRTYNKNKKTYLDWEGYERTKNGEGVYTTIDCNNHIIRKNQNGKIIQDYTQEKINNIFSDPKLTVIQVEVKPKYHRRFTDEPLGRRFRDKQNGNIYVVRKFKIPGYNNYVSFYMDINSLHLIRIIDEEEVFCKKHNIKMEDIYVFIRDFNNKQDKNDYCYRWEKFYNNREYLAFNNREVD